MKGRGEAIRAILERHGMDAIYVASTGFTGRAVFAEAGNDYCVFYMQGSMGLAPAIGLGMALRSQRDIVVISGDASLLMSLGVTHTLRDYAPTHFFCYVLDNGCHESVGGQPSADLEPGYSGITEIVEVEREGKPPRVGVDPRDNTRRVRETLASYA
jgi:phosphonopyruvate decarboxylase